MRLLFLTQDDPFYLPTIYKYLIPKLKKSKHEIVGAVVFDVAPFGKKESKIKQFFDTLKLFGLSFTFHYSLKFIFSFFKQNIKDVLKNEGIDYIKISGSINDEENLKMIKDLNIDLLVSLAGNQIFKKKLMDSSKFGVINLHSALLPKYRGLMPSFWVLCNNEKFTGVSVFFVDSGIDSGPIIIQKKIEINKETQSELIWKLKFLGADSIVEACDLIQKFGIKTPTIKNDKNKMTYFSKPTRNDVIKFLENNKFY